MVNNVGGLPSVANLHLNSLPILKCGRRRDRRGAGLRSRRFSYAYEDG